MSAAELPNPLFRWPMRAIDARERFFQLRYENLFVSALLALGFAGLTGLSAQVAIYTPLTSVPFTLQVLVVLTSGMVLGYRWGTASQVLYVLLGAFLVPWYAPAAGAAAFSTGGLSAGPLAGTAVLTGVLGGYLIGFPVSAFVVGLVSDRWLEGRSAFSQLAVNMAGVAIIYLCGATVFWMVLHDPSSSFVLKEAVLPFIPVDLAKALVAGGIGTLLIAKRPFGPERQPPSAYRRWWPAIRSVPGRTGSN